MTRKRKIFDPSLKLEVVRMITEQGLSVQNVSESMSIGPTAIRRWPAQYSANRTASPESVSHSLRTSSASANWNWKTSNSGKMSQYLKKLRPSLPAK